MRCSLCSKPMKKVKMPYHFKGSGLDNVYLSGIPVYRCACGEVIAKIPHMKELLETIGEAIVNKPAPLTGKEIRFLRKNSGNTAEMFARLLHADPSTLSRWETGKNPIGAQSDRLIRLLYAFLMNFEDRDRLFEVFLKLRDAREIRRIKVTRSPRKGYQIAYA